MKVYDVRVLKKGIGYVEGARTTMYKVDAVRFEERGFIKILGEHKPEDVSERQSKKAPAANRK